MKTGEILESLRVLFVESVKKITMYRSKFTETVYRKMVLEKCILITA